MRNNSRRQIGYDARADGLEFQAKVASIAGFQGYAVTQIPDGCVVYRERGGRPALRRVKTPFDMLIAKGGKSCFFDCKKIKDGNLTYCMLKSHQVESLYDQEVRGGNTAGYLVKFEYIGGKVENRVVFFPAVALKRLTRRQSLSYLEGIEIGSGDNLNLSKMFRGADGSSE